MLAAPPRVCRRCRKLAEKSQLVAKAKGRIPIDVSPFVNTMGVDGQPLMSSTSPLSPRVVLDTSGGDLQSLCCGTNGHHTQKTTQDALRGKARAR